MYYGMWYYRYNNIPVTYLDTLCDHTHGST